MHLKQPIFLLACCILMLLSSCQKELNYSVDESLATGTLYDTSGACMADSVHGTYYAGITPGSDTAFIDVQVNITQTGSYSISTDDQNGFKFADSGSFNTTGLNTIHLKPIGTPALAQQTTFNISFNSSFCTFIVNVEDSTGTGLGGKDTTANDNWQFNNDTSTLFGPIDSAFLITDTSGITYLELIGTTESANDSIFSLLLIMPGDSIVTGTYTTQAMPFANAIFTFSDLDGNIIYYAANDQGLSLITVNITSYDSTTKIVKGNFSGTANDANGNPDITISNGSFSAAVSP